MEIISENSLHSKQWNGSFLEYVKCETEFAFVSNE